MIFQINEISVPFDWRIVNHNEVYRERIDAIMNDKGLSYFSEGRTRRVYLSRNERYVIKVPLNEQGLHINWNESYYYKESFKKKHQDGIEYAPCRLIQNYFLMMHRCYDTYGNGRLSKSDLPNWAGFIDCMQVGRLANGKIVAYDYGE